MAAGEPGSVGRDNASFRQGLVLGLTLAELGILMIFVLLLAFGAMLIARDREIAALRAAAPRAHAAERVAAMLRQRTSLSAEAVRSMTEELVDAAVREEAATKAKSTLVEANAKLAKKAAALDAALAALPEGQRAVAATLAAANLENDRLKGSMAYATRRLAALGKVSEQPACWATAAGAPEYIFDVALQTGGIAVANRALPNRRAEQATLPLGAMRYGQTLSGPVFQAMTAPLYAWGQAHGCRFFVTVSDRTGAAEKGRYKTLLMFVEGRFYKYENR